MKRFLPLFIIAIAFSSCQEDVKFNNPGFQGLKDDVFWRANDVRAYANPVNHKLRIEALTEYETLVLTTANYNVGKYVLGTTNALNSATYSSDFNDVALEYATIAVPGPVGEVTLVTGGTGYASGTAVTTGGLGTGLTVNVVANASGVVTAATISSRGNAYVAGDIITISGGNGNAKIRVTNVQNSNGEIEITEYDELNATVSGKFKFNAANVNNSPFGGPILNFQYGEFYKIQIYPEL